MSKSTDNPHNFGPEVSKNVIEFLRVAHEYCLFIEKAGEKSRVELLDFCQKIGPLLYLKGLLLPEITPDYPESVERYVTEEEWQDVFNVLRSIFADWDEFYHIDHEEGIAYEPVKGSLSENFTDIFQDLKDFILLYKKESEIARQNAVYECKTLFSARWGHKLLSNLRYLHALATGEETDQDLADDDLW